MKKLWALILSICMMFSLLSMPAQAADNKVEKILANVKLVFSIDDTDMKFTYSQFNATDEIGGYRFVWNGNKKDAYIDVQTDENGHIISMDSYRDNENESRVPKLSMSQAVDLAYDKLAAIYPEAVSQISKKYVEASSGYFIQFHRVINETVVRDNYLSIYINAMTGDIEHYDAESWVLNVKDPAKDTLISSENLGDTFVKNLPLTLQYQAFFNEKTQKRDVKLVYAPREEDQNRYIDARTGENILVTPNNRYFYAGGKGAANDAESSISLGEQAEINRHNNFITAEKAKSSLSQITSLDYDASTVLTSNDLYADESLYSDQTDYRLVLSMEKNEDNYFAMFEPQSGRLVSYNAYHANSSYDANAKPSISYSMAKETAKSFLNTCNAEHFKKSRLVETSAETAFSDGYYRFTYVRQENAVDFSENELSVTINAFNGKVTYYQENWNDDVKFPMTTGAISTEKAVKAHLGYFKTPVSYLATISKENGMEEADLSGSYQQDVTLIPVYSYQDDAYVDAKTGQVINYAMELYEKQDTYLNLAGLYPQLAGHYCKDIALKLFDMDIVPKNKNFKPDEAIPAEEFSELVSSINYGDSIALDNYTSGNTITRINGVRMIIDSMGYKKVAQKSDIFTCTFADKTEIGKANIGYATIAKGLGICQGTNNKFMPNKTLTYAEALIMIYNAVKA